MKKILLLITTLLILCQPIFAQVEKPTPVSSLRFKRLSTSPSVTAETDSVYVNEDGAIILLHPDSSFTVVGITNTGSGLNFDPETGILTLSQNPGFGSLALGENSARVNLSPVANINGTPGIRVLNTEYVNSSYDASLNIALHEGKQFNFIDEDGSYRLKIDSPSAGQLRLRDGDNNPALSGVIKSVAGVLTGNATPADLGLASYSYFTPDKPPSLPSGLNQEFNSSFTITDQFTVIGDGAGVSRSFSNASGTLTYTVPSTASNAFRSIVEALPSGDFTVITKITVAGAGTNLDYQSEGLIFSDTNNGTSGNQFTVAFGHNTNVIAVSDLYTNWGNYSSTNAMLNNNLNQSGTDRTNITGYLKCTRSGSTYTVSYSISAYPGTWKASTISPGFTPTYFGLFFNSPSGGSGAPLIVHVDWLRYWNSATADPGGLVNFVTQ